MEIESESILINGYIYSVKEFYPKYIPVDHYKNILQFTYNRKENMFQRIKLVKISLNCIYNGRFRRAKV
jgi:hypothetical protein